MKNLENYGVQEMNAQEIRGINGGSTWWPSFDPIDYLIGKAVDLVIDFIAYDNAAYGAWLMKTGSPGGAK